VTAEKVSVVATFTTCLGGAQFRSGSGYRISGLLQNRRAATILLDLLPSRHAQHRCRLHTERYWLCGKFLVQ